MADYPSQVPTFTLVGKIARGVADSSDPGYDPDLVAIDGVQVICTPNRNPPIFKVPNAVPPVTIFQETIIGTTDSTGVIVSQDELGGQSPGIKLPFWGTTWSITVIVGGNFPNQVVTTAGVAGGVVDFTTLVSVPEDPGSELSAWTEAVARAETAASAAADSAQEAEDAANASGGIPNTLIYREQNSDGSYPPVGTVPLSSKLVYIGTTFPDPATLPAKTLFFQIS